MVDRAEQLALVEESQQGFEPALEYEQLPPYARAEIDALFLSLRFPERSFEELLEEQLAEQRERTEEAVLTVVEPAEEVEPEVVVPEKPAAAKKKVKKQPKLAVVGPEFEHIGDVGIQEFANRFERFVESEWIGAFGKVGRAAMIIYMCFLPGRDGRWKCETQRMVGLMKKRVLGLELDDPKYRKQRAYMIQFLDQFAA